MSASPLWQDAFIGAVETLDIELLARLNPIQVPELGRQNNLALG